MIARRDRVEDERSLVAAVDGVWARAIHRYTPDEKAFVTLVGRVADADAAWLFWPTIARDEGRGRSEKERDSFQPPTVGERHEAIIRPRRPASEKRAVKAATSRVRTTEALSSDRRSPLSTRGSSRRRRRRPRGE